MISNCLPSGLSTRSIRRVKIKARMLRGCATRERRTAILRPGGDHHCPAVHMCIRASQGDSYLPPPPSESSLSSYRPMASSLTLTSHCICYLMAPGSSHLSPSSVHCAFVHAFMIATSVCGRLPRPRQAPVNADSSSSTPRIY